MKRLLGVLLILTLTMTMFIGCASEESSDVELTLMINFQTTEKITETFREVIADFEAANPGITVTLVPGNAEYEAVMKTKMAANDLPDMWSTHGWSVARYSEYLEPLTDQAWVSKLNPGIQKVVTSKEGEVFVLPLDVDLSGIAYNKTVLDTAGVNVDDIKTWDDFMVACDAVKAAGYTPIHVGGKDSWTVGNFFDWTAPSFFITNDGANDRAAFKDGSFEWSKWEEVAQLLVDLNDNEYLNVDKLSSGYTDSAKNLAQDKTAFTFYGNYVIAEALNYNPDANVGFMPVPSNDPADEPTLISGERTTVGMWKDSEHKEEALKFINFLAEPAQMSRLASANALPAGLQGVESDTGILKDDYEKYAALRGFPYFDREYLPSGMWDTMCSTGTGLLTGEMTLSDAAAQMKKDYDRLK
ncbi:extracellular solute-binding protein [Acidaminobacter sp. JC074]|uniref:ABC transporter substrate-binding protein n=1 Tax=Acidaminobacter sp. JC074 TaxID=2530199 RepID=UPI001F0DDFD1|nr:extracellular solute-binding protein [Acidaminobacter sp. JC074]MCH4885953.1 extracellular solute-binding protein [Acidaminobacter sp. JC074]